MDYGDVTIAGEGLQNFGLCSVLRALEQGGIFKYHTCCETGPPFFRSHPEDRPIQSLRTTCIEMQRAYSNPDPSAFRSDNHRSVGYDLKKRIEVTCQNRHWHVK
jgi:hypothetical protein